MPIILVPINKPINKPNLLALIKFFFSKSELALIREKILYKKIMALILKKQLLTSIVYILKFPNNIKKIKLFLALLVPKSILEKKKEF